MKKLLGPLVAVVVTVGVMWVAKELKGLGSIEFGILDEDDPEEDAVRVPLTFWEDLHQNMKDPEFAERFKEELKLLTEGTDTSFSQYFDLLAGAPPTELRQRLLEFKQYLDNAEDDRAAEQFEADVVTQTGMNFGDWLQSPEGEKALSDPEESVESVQHHGDYAEALTMADLEGISVPDLTSVVEDLKRDAMNPIDKSLVDMVSTWDTTDPASLHEERMMSLDQDVVDDFVIDEPVTATAHFDPDGPFLEDGPYKGYPLSDPRLLASGPSPTAEAPGDVSTVWAEEIKDAIGIEPVPYGAQLASQPKD